MRVEESVEINRPLREVFDYVANPQKLPEWSGLAIEVRDTPEPLGEGDTFIAVGRFLGRRFETPYKRVGVEAGRRYTDRAMGGPVPDQDWIYTFEEITADTTRLARAVEGEPGASSRWPNRSSSGRSSAK